MIAIHFFLTVDICSPLTAPTNGDVLVSGLTLGSQAVYSCDVGYELVGIARRECSVDGIWSGSVPFCRREFIHNCMHVQVVSYTTNIQHCV